MLILETDRSARMRILFRIVIMIYIATYRYYICWYWRLIEVRGCEYWSRSSMSVCIYVIVIYERILRPIDILFADIGNSDRSAWMRILVKIVIARIYVCHLDIYYCILTLYLWILENLNEVRGCAYWSRSSMSVCMYVITINVATYWYYICGYWKLCSKSANVHTGQDRHCPYVSMSSGYKLRHINIIFADIDDSDFMFFAIRCENVQYQRFVKWVCALGIL